MTPPLTTVVKNLKILLVTEHYPPDVSGGGELSAEHLAGRLADAGHEVHVLTSGSKADPHAAPLPITLHRTLRTGAHTTPVGNLWRTLVLPSAIRREVRRLDAEHHFDAIHYLNVLSVLGATEDRTRQFATINSYQPFCPKGNLFYKEREPCTGCAPLKFVGCMASSEYVGKMRVSPVLRANPLFLGVLYGQYLRFRRALRRVRPVAVSVFVSD